MAAAGSYGITITAVDKISDVLKGINTNLSKLLRPFKELGGVIDKIGRLPGIGLITTAIGKLSSIVISTISHVAKLSLALIGLSSFGIIDGFYKIMTSAAAMGNALVNASARTGVGVAQLAKFQGAARLSGVSVDAMTSSLENLGDTMLQAKFTGQGNAARLLAFWNIDTNQSPDKALDQIMPKLKSLSAVQQRLALDTLGLSRELIPLIAGWQEAKDRAAKFNPIAEAGAQALDKMYKSGLDLKESLMGVANQIAIDLAPEVTKMISGWTNWIATNRVWLAQKIEEYIHKIVEAVKTMYEWLKKQDWHEYWEKLKLVVEGLAVLWGISLVASLSTLAVAIGAFMGTPAVAALVALMAAWQGFRIGSTVSQAEEEKITGGGKGERLPPRPKRSWWDRVTPNSGTVLPMTPGEAAWADSIAKIEGAGYGTMNGGETFDNNNSAHPNRVGRGGTSTAAGRYQFVHGTWMDAIKALGLPDVMSDENQDKAFQWLMQKRHGITPEMMNDPAQTQTIVNKLRTEWPSLPGGSQSRTDSETFNQLLERHRRRETEKARPAFGPNADPKLPAPTLTPQSAPTPASASAPPPTADGKLSVTVDVKAPPGTSVSVQKHGSIFQSPRSRRVAGGSLPSGSDVFNGIINDMLNANAVSEEQPERTSTRTGDPDELVEGGVLGQVRQGVVDASRRGDERIRQLEAGQ